MDAVPSGAGWVMLLPLILQRRVRFPAANLDLPWVLHTWLVSPYGLTANPSPHPQTRRADFKFIER